MKNTCYWCVGFFAYLSSSGSLAFSFSSFPDYSVSFLRWQLNYIVIGTVKFITMKLSILKKILLGESIYKVWKRILLSNSVCQPGCNRQNKTRMV